MQYSLGILLRVWSLINLEKEGENVFDMMGFYLYFVSWFLLFEKLLDFTSTKILDFTSSKNKYLIKHYLDNNFMLYTHFPKLITFYTSSTSQSIFSLDHSLDKITIRLLIYSDR